MRPEIVGMERMQTELDAERDLTMAVSFMTIGFIVLALLALLGFIWFMEKAQHHRAIRKGHDTDDPYCKFWAYSKPGAYMHANCDPCELEHFNNSNKEKQPNG